jgi:hypothetical protein
VFDASNWERIALTRAQVNRGPRQVRQELLSQGSGRQEDWLRQAVPGNRVRGHEADRAYQADAQVARRSAAQAVRGPTRVVEDQQRDRVRALVDEWFDYQDYEYFPDFPSA